MSDYNNRSDFVSAAFALLFFLCAAALIALAALVVMMLRAPDDLSPERRGELLVLSVLAVATWICVRLLTTDRRS